jgi:hypothetical protein
MWDEDESVSIAVNGKPVRSSGHRGAVSRVMSVMRNACASGKLGECFEETSWDGASWGVCEHACWDSEARRGGLGSDRELERRPEDSGKVQGDQTGFAERVCDTLPQFDLLVTRDDLFPAFGWSRAAPPRCSKRLTGEPHFG